MNEGIEKKELQRRKKCDLKYTSSSPSSYPARSDARYILVLDGHQAHSVMQLLIGQL